MDLVSGAPALADAFACRWYGSSPRFVCVLAHTDTTLIPGLSLAGTSQELLPFTPAADAETILLGAPTCLERLPSNPAGPPGPSGITGAALCLAATPAEFYAAGLRVWPSAPHVTVSRLPGGRIDLGCGAAESRHLFRMGCQTGRSIGASTRHLVLAESVPGGTTTALALLVALGVPAFGRVSGSVPDGAHHLKEQVVRAALACAGLSEGLPGSDALAAVERLGDPMQPFAAGLALGAAQMGVDVLLAGGTQMLAVIALVLALDPAAPLERFAIGTTRWVAEDPSADLAGLAHDVCPLLPVLAARLDFSSSRHTGLQAYERFFVKEGAGAGGACVAALLAGGIKLAALHVAIDATYDGLLAAPH